MLHGIEDRRGKAYDSAAEVMSSNTVNTSSAVAAEARDVDDLRRIYLGTASCVDTYVLRSQASSLNRLHDEAFVVRDCETGSVGPFSPPGVVAVNGWMVRD